MRSRLRFNHLAVWSLLLAVFQAMLIAPVDKGQKYAHVLFQKPIGHSIAIPEGLLTAEPTAEDDRQQPSAPTVLLTRGEHLFHPIIDKVANKHEIDPALIKAIIMAESGYNPRAISKRGARGLMQLMPATAAALGVVDIFNPEHNINAGVIYFKRLMDHFEGDVRLALAAYNAGIRKVKKYQGIPPFKATRYYIKKVFQYYEHYRQQMRSSLDQA